MRKSASLTSDHSGEFLAAKTFLMGTVFAVLVYERRDKIAVLRRTKNSCKVFRKLCHVFHY